MAWQRDEANLGISGATAYSYTEVDWSVNATHAVYRHIGGVTSPYYFSASATSTLQWWESGTWHDYAGPTSASFGGYGDLAILDVTDSFQRQAADRTVSLGCYTSMLGGGARAWIDYTVPHLAPSVTWASSNPVVRNSDNSITLSWNAPALEYSAMCIEVQTDNSGTWSQEIVLWNTATTTTWTGCSAGHSYQFRIRSNYLASYSDYDVCATVITNTPLPPDKLTTQATSGTWVDVILENNSAVATSVTYELSADGSTWVAGDSGQPLTGFSVNMGSYHYIRVKNVNSTGSSNWRASGYIKTVTVPNPPTLLSPTGTLNLSTAGGNVTFSWQHNSVDGSAQTAAKLRYSTDGGTTWASTINMNPKLTETYTMAIPWAAGTTVTWQAKTRGAATTGGSTNDGFSDWSASSEFKVATEPTAPITIEDAETIGGMQYIHSMPLSITANYTDASGTVVSDANTPKVTLKQGDRTIASKTATVSGSTITASFGINDAILENGAEYTIVLDVRSSSGLQASANASFTTAFTEPQAGELSITNDPDTGYASLMATFDNHATDVEYSGATNSQFETTEGYVRSLTVEGMSQKWNQRCDVTKFQTNGSTISISGNSCTVTATSGRSGTWFGVNVAPFNVNTVAALNHVYLFEFDLNVSGIAHASNFNWVAPAFGSIGYTLLDGVVQANSTKHWDYIVRSGNSGTYGSIYMNANYNATIDQTGEAFTLTNMCIIDLTAIYGAGNEPTALTDPRIAWLKAYALAHPAYDAGSLVSIEGAGVRGRNLADFTAASQYTINADGTLTLNSTGGFNIKFAALPNAAYYVYCRVVSGGYSGTTLFTWQGASYYYDNEGTSKQGSNASALNALWVPASANFTVGTVIELMVTSTQSTAYEPYRLTTITATLRSAGSISDQLQVDKTEAQVERKVGYVDLGTLTWTKRNGVGMQTGGLSSLIKSPSANDQLPNVMMPNATPMTWTLLVNSGTSSGGVGVSSGYLAISTTATDPAAFKTAMSGVYLFYELATPTTDTLPDISLIQLGTAATVLTDLDSTFEMTGWDGSADAVSISVARVNADGITPLIEDGASGSGAVDKYAPLNTQYQYAVTTKSSANAVKTVYVDNEIVTDLWFAYWGENVASAKWNPDNGGIQIARPQKTRVYYAGRKDPVSYDGAAVALSETPSWMLVDRSEVQPFVQLIEDGGRGVYKSCDGWVYHADFDLTLTPKYIAIGYYGGVGLTITRIAGDAL